MNNLKILKRIIVGLILGIIVLTILEFPAPIGFETRPQDNVSLLWLILFFAIIASQLATLFLVFKWPRLGGYLGLAAAILNILQIIADQTHLMQPEIAPLGYLLLEDAVGLLSLFLGYFSWKIVSKPFQSPGTAKIDNQ